MADEKKQQENNLKEYFITYQYRQDNENDWMTTSGYFWGVDEFDAECQARAQCFGMCIILDTVEV